MSSMFKMVKILSLFFFGFFCNISYSSAQSVKLYEANIPFESKDTSLIVLEIVKKENGAATGFLTFPHYMQNRLKLENCSIIGDSIFFEYPRFDIDFKGSFNSSGISGLYRAGEEIYSVSFDQFELSHRRPQAPKPPFSYIAKEVSYYSSDSLIRYGGTLTLPNEKGKFPAVVLLSGSGPQDRDATMFYHKPFLVIADYLTERGFAVLRLDDRGVGGPTGGKLANTTNDYAYDALEAVAYLKRQKNVNQSSIGLIGHSEGGIIAFLAAGRSSDIAFIVSLASPGLSGKEITLSQLR